MILKLCDIVKGVYVSSTWASFRLNEEADAPKGNLLLYHEILKTSCQSKKFSAIFDSSTKLTCMLMLFTWVQ